METLNELSGHADQNELLRWMKPLSGSLKKVFIVHGEPVQSAGLARAIQNEPVIPARAVVRVGVRIWD